MRDPVKRLGQIIDRLEDTYEDHGSLTGRRMEKFIDNLSEVYEDLKASGGAQSNPEPAPNPLMDIVDKLGGMKVVLPLLGGLLVGGMLGGRGGDGSQPTGAPTPTMPVTPIPPGYTIVMVNGTPTLAPIGAAPAPQPPISPA